MKTISVLFLISLLFSTNSFATNESYSGLIRGSDLTCSHTNMLQCLGCVIHQKKVICGGHNDFGQKGIGTTERNGGFREVSLPPNSSRPVEVSHSSTHACALLEDTTALCWGNNEEGQLGDGTLVDKLIPIYVVDPQTNKPLSDIESIKAEEGKTEFKLTNGETVVY